MFRTPAAMFGLIGAAFLMGSLAPDTFATATRAAQGLHRQAQDVRKGDRVAAPVLADERKTVSTVELIGVSRATVILRDHAGEVLYQFDPEAGTTAVSKDTDLPIVTLKELTTGPAVQHPVKRQEGSEEPAPEQKKRRNPVGCVGDVSPLVKSSAGRTPTLCLALLEHARS